MSFDVIFTLSTLVFVLVALAVELTTADVLLMAALAAVVAGGVIPLEEALQGFANTTLLALGSLYVVAGALRESGALARLPGLALDRLPGLALARIDRGETAIAPVGGDEELQAGDRLFYAAAEDAPAPPPDLTGYPGLRLALRSPGVEPDGEEPEPQSERELHEAVVREGSRLVGSTVEEANFLERFNAAVTGVRRGGKRIDEPIGEIVLHPGDTLMLDTGRGFRTAFEDSPEFFVMSEVGGDEVPEEAGPREASRPRMLGAAAVLCGVVALAAAGVMHIALAALIGAIAVVGLGYLSPGEARESIDWSVLIVIGASLGLGSAMEASGALGPRAVLAGLFVATMVLTGLITNNAAAAIMFPIALSVSNTQGLNERPLFVAITIAASLTLWTPLGYQTNLMVYGPGNYRFGDFTRLGLPLQLLLTVGALGAAGPARLVAGGRRTRRRPGAGSRHGLCSLSLRWAGTRAGETYTRKEATLSDIERVGVVGCGLMGSGIAQVSAQAGYETVVREIDDEALERGMASIEKNLSRAVEKEKLDEDERDAVLDRLTGTLELADLGDRDIVVEAVVEDLDVKTDVFEQLDEACGEDTIFASNTSSLTVTEMAAATDRPDRFVGLHFFNPVPVMKLVEVVSQGATDDDVFETAYGFAESLGKEPIACRDNSGFIVNRILVPYMMDAIRAYENGIGSIEDIDKGMELGTGYPMGPFTLGDFVGLDTLAKIGEIMFEEYREKRFAPPPLLRRMVTAGHYGRKTGRGFYDYGGEAPEVSEFVKR